MSKAQSTTKLSLKDAIAKTSDVSKGYYVGLKALKAVDLKHITAKNNDLIGGSLDIDSCTMKYYPDDARWDYAIEYDSKVCFIEVHPAETSNVKDIVNKKSWLISWLKTKAPFINQLPPYSPRFIWIASGRCNILKTSTQYKQAAKNGLLPKKHIVLGENTK